MAKMVGLEDDLYDEVSKLANENPVEFPSIKNFVDKAVKKELDRLKNESK